MGQKYTLATIKKLFNKRTSSNTNPEDFLSLYYKFLGEIVDDVKKLSDRYEFEEEPLVNEEENYYYDLPRDFYAVESVKGIVGNIGDLNQKSYRNFSKTSITSLYANELADTSENKYQYYIINDRIVFPYIK
jgi:hypothetical protein